MNVYYAELSNLILPEPEPATKLVAKRFSNINELGGLFKCPAFTNEMKHTFIVPSPYTVTIEWDGNFVRTPNNNQSFFDKNFFVRHAKDGLMSISFVWYIFFTDADSLEMTQLPAYMLDSDLDRKTSFIGGTMDIGKHFRSLDMVRILNEPGQIIINRGDPLYAVRFSTDEPITLKRFKLTEESRALLDGVSNTLDKTGRVRPLQYWYDLTKKYRLKEKLLASAKQNLF